jgi:hypothetical protein
MFPPFGVLAFFPACRALDTMTSELTRIDASEKAAAMDAVDSFPQSTASEQRRDTGEQDGGVHRKRSSVRFIIG